MRPHLELKIHPNNVMDNLTMLGYGCTRDGPQPHEEIFHTKQLVHLQDSPHTVYTSPISLDSNHQKLTEERPAWQMAHSSSSGAVCKDPAMASFTLDMELERCKQQSGRKHEFTSRMPVTQGQSANFNPLQSVVQSAEMDLNNCSLGPVGVNNTKEWSPNNVVSANEYTVNNDDKTNLGLGGQGNNYYSIMEDDESILLCRASSSMKTHNSGVDPGPVITDSETLAAKINTEEKSTSTVSCFPTCDTMVGTELVLSVSAFTQTDHPKTADKHVVTEVHMADLDYLAAEFVRLKTAQEELQEKEKCDCVQRAQQAELCLLALQYNMCRQHCWRLYYTSAEGHQFPTIPGDMSQCWPKEPPARFLSILQKLESDYNQMRKKILEGVSLEQLKPLSVDSEKVTTATSYIPAQVIGNVWENVPPWSSQEPRKHNTSGDKNGCNNNKSTNGCQGCSQSETSKMSKAVENKNVDTRRVDTIVPQGKAANHDAHKLEEKQTTTRKELNTSEAWYDAEEDLEPAGSTAAGTGEDKNKIAKDSTYETISVEVSILPSNVAEDVTLSEKYQASDVSMSALENGLSGQRTELSGSSRHGHTLHGEHINRASSGSQCQASTPNNGPECSQDATKTQSPKTDASSTERKLVTQPSINSSVKTRKVVCISPTAKGTCVPQHYGTMGSFDTLMAELTQHHPDIGRQRIVDALVELRAKHQGVLSGLPLRTIREMTSELLIRPASVAQL
ncbi:RNA-binding protein 44 [Mastacembelus armatus]|uniref:RNA-binding protein 44 n=1 Tax=Mastacembelus armatus TaxID=205130 RepID=UPI000E45AF84|nr:RNA-binding protein 44 [Mastacembelus armatus]